MIWQRLPVNSISMNAWAHIDRLVAELVVCDHKGLYYLRARGSTYNSLK